MDNLVLSVMSGRAGSPDTNIKWIGVMQDYR